MELLVFAHRGEAQAFLSKLDFSKIEAHPYELYHSTNLDLLICGEGYLEALKACLTTLCLKPYQKITNLGIAGSLTGNLNLGDITEVRTSYRYFNETPIFKSHTSASQAHIDCISYNKRVLTSEDTKNLKVHGHIVDRELWGVAEACKVFKIPFQGYKLISDIAGQTECELVAQKANEYSYQLYDFYNKNYQPSQETEHIKLTSIQDEFIQFLSPTFSQRVQLEKLFFKCQLKEIDLSDIYKLDEYIDWPRKKRNQSIIKSLMAKIDPIQARLDSFCLNMKGSSYKALPNPETPHIEVKTQVHNSNELAELIKELKDIQWDKLEQVYQGQL